MTDATPEFEIITLDPMRVASARAYGRNPEQAAWAILLDWARTQGLGGELAQHRFFGFNHPDPAPGQEEYGYEQWMTVNDEACPRGPVHVKKFAGGRYLTAPCHGAPHLSQRWRELFSWCEQSPYTADFKRQYLEECLTPLALTPEEIDFRLYLPVRAAFDSARAAHAA